MTLMNQQLPLLTEVQALHAAINNEKILIIDLCQAQVYSRAHIPGAIHLPYAKLASGTPPATGKLPPKGQLNKILSEIGYQPDKHVIAYDDEGGGWAGRFLWTLDVIGHAHYSYLNGGLHAWLAEKLPVEATPNTATPTQVNITLRDEPCANKDYIIERLNKPTLAIWDARSLEEYEGSRAFARRAGHIPGAVHYEWTSAMDTQNAFRVRHLETLRHELAQIGITQDKEIITHCQTHHRSGFTYLIAKILGFPNVKAYPGSWSEWGNDENTPIETSLPA